MLCPSNMSGQFGAIGLQNGYFVKPFPRVVGYHMSAPGGREPLVAASVVLICNATIVYLYRQTEKREDWPKTVCKWGNPRQAERLRGSEDVTAQACAYDMGV